MPTAWQLLRVLPRARKWVRALLAEHANDATPVLHHLASPDGEASLAALRRCCDDALLARARVVVVNERTPELPLDDWGLADIDALSADQTRGITFEDTFFVVPDGRADASLFFHELVHIVQWHVLGPSRFLTLYGFGLLAHGYRHSPLEVMAYDMQARFDAGHTFDLTQEATTATQRLATAFRKQNHTQRLAWHLAPYLR